MSRPDGRENYEFRKVEIVLGGLARADGSARFSFGEVVAHFTLSLVLNYEPGQVAAERSRR